MCLVHVGSTFFHKHRYNGTPVGALTDATFVDDLLEGIACQVSSVTPILADAVKIKQVVAMIGWFLIDYDFIIVYFAYIGFNPNTLVFLDEEGIHDWWSSDSGSAHPAILKGINF